MAIRQSLTAIEAVIRENADELGLESADVLIVLLLGQTPSYAASDLARFSGRARQQVQRSLAAMEERGVVEGGRLASGRVTAWRLTQEGICVLKRLEVRLLAYEEIIGKRTDLKVFTTTLTGIAESLVNRPSAYGWRRGLQVPHESRLDPNWDRESTEAPLGWEPLHEPLFANSREEGPEGAGVAERVIPDDKSLETQPIPRVFVIEDDTLGDLDPLAPAFPQSN